MYPFHIVHKNYYKVVFSIFILLLFNNFGGPVNKLLVTTSLYHSEVKKNSNKARFFEENLSFK